MSATAHVAVWRVGHRADPLGFTPHELCAWNHRFDEARHARLLNAHGMSHLDVHEVTARRRAVTQTIAGALYDEGAAGIRFPSRLDGLPCVAVFEGRGRLSLVAEPLVLTDPAPDELLTVADSWKLAMEPSQPLEDSLQWSDARTLQMIDEEPW